MADILEFRSNDLALFYLQVTLMLPTWFGVNWPFGSEEVRNRFSSWWPFWISDQNDFSCFDLLITPMFPIKTIGLSFQEKRKIDFQDSCHVGFPIETILAIFFIYKSSWCFQQFHVSWPFVSSEEAKNRFSKWWPWRPAWISNWNNFSYFGSTRHPNAPFQASSQMAFRFRRRSEKQTFKIVAMAAILDFGLEQF